MAEAPVLQTPRLRLRGHTLDDFDAVAAMWADPELVRHIGKGLPLDEEAVFSKLLRMAGTWALLGFGFWAIEEASSGRLIGEIGFLARRPQGGPLHPESGWALATGARGQGFASEALAAVLAWGDGRFARTVCIISPDNSASVKLARRHGYRETGPAPAPADWMGPAFVGFERERPAGLG